ncbi:MAG: AAA family ATPase, partial [Polyangiaceae bacterium]|nr:AAA family ATPase [Polyangiaceae bacterium]
LIGRELELARIAERFSTAKNAGSVVLLRGLRGAGKSRLVLAAHDAWHEAGRVRTLATTCREGDPPWAALRRLFDAFVEASRRATGPDRTAMVDALARAAEGHLGALAALVSPELGALIGVTSEAAVPPSIAEGLGELLVRLARRVGPVLISVDDLQWIDPPSREVFAKVAHRVQEAPLVLLLASRVDAAGEIPVERFRGSELPRAEIVDLGVMAGIDVEGIVTSHLGGTAVEPEAIQRVAALSDGTPLGILEVLAAMLDTGALRPQRGTWKLDRERAERVALPAGAVALLGRRLGELPPATRRVLDHASVLGVVFEDALLASVLEMSETDVGFALADGRRAGVLVADGTEGHRFVHDGIREIVLARLSEPTARAAHQRAAEVLMRAPRASVDVLFAMADHFQSGEVDVAPARGYAAARRAAAAALELFDNENALRFLAFARSAAGRAGLPLDADYHRALGEAHLRLGSLSESAASFASSIEVAETSRQRAELLGRMAWVHQTAAEPERAWAYLATAFEAVGAKMPTESAGSATSTACQLARWGGKALRVLARDGSSGRVREEDIPLLCDLHYQNARLGMEYGKPLRLVQSTIQAMDLSAGLGPSRAHARTLAMRGFVMTALGSRKLGAADLSAARQIADAIADAPAGAFALQLQVLAATVAGDLDRALELHRELEDERAHWMEVHEYCLIITNADILESLRGRVRESVGWLDRVVQRVQRSGRSTAAYDEMLIHRVHAAYVAAGLPIRQQPRPPSPRGFLRTLAWGPRLRTVVEAGDVGDEFEALVSEFESEGHNPRTTHMAVGEYYVAVVQGRIHRCLRATAAARPALVPALERAIRDLGIAARIPLLKMHHVLAEAYLAFFVGKTSDAFKLAAKAEATARDETCPVILYGAARLRAHAFLAAGKRVAANDEARIAETIAMQHGSVCRAIWIRDELGLSPAQPAALSSDATSHRSEAGGTRYLSALVQVARAGLKDLRVTPQASAILDELLRDADASRGFLWLRVDPARGAFGAIGRTRAGESIEDTGGKLEGLFRSVMETQTEWPSDDDGRVSVRASAGWLPGLDPRRTLVLPLMLADRAVGALLLSRTADQPAFSFGIRRVLSMLVHQVALALELSRVFEERDRLQRSLQQAQKMEAVGRLAASVAHDMNNMLQVTQSSLERLCAAKPDGEVEEDVRLLSEGTAKAQGLVRQLLTFSRVRSASRERMHLHELILRNESLMRTLLGKPATLELRLEAVGPWVHVDPTLLEQSLFNLVINARDAIGDREGTLTIATETVRIQESAPGGPGPGEHVLLTVRDTGSGMSEDVAARVFEPFFTTKGEGSGTGLGLSTVYGFVQNSGGHIDLTSAPGKGATFSIHLPTQTQARPAPSVSKRTSVLVVDDEEIVANSLRRVLEAAGHRVLVALNATDALAVARKHQPDIALALVDVRLADTTGPQLVQKLWELEVPRKVIYMSGHLPEDVLRELGDAPVVDKPFSSSELLRRIELMKNSP